MVDVAHAVGYRTGYVQLFERSKLARSDAKREIKRVESEKPDLMVVSMFVDRYGDSKYLAKAVRLLTAVMEQQLRSGRQLLLYGQDNASAWCSSQIAPFLRDARIKETRLRWCNLVGPQAYAEGPGFRSVVKIFSNVQLWDGPTGADQRCEHQRDEHALYEDYLTGPSNYSRRRQLWQGITLLPSCIGELRGSSGAVDTALGSSARATLEATLEASWKADWKTVADDVIEGLERRVTACRVRKSFESCSRAVLFSRSWWWQKQPAKE